MRLPFLRPKPEAEPTRKPPSRAERPRAAIPEAGDVAVARTRARRRLVGAMVLLLVGVVGFPVLFETQPRPLPLDTPIELPRREGAAPAPTRPGLAPRSTPLPVTPAPADAGNEVIVATSPAPASAATATVTPVLTSAAPPAPPAPKPAVIPVVTAPASATVPALAVPVRTASASAPAPAPRPAASAARPNDGARAAALLDGSPASTAGAGRFVVQVGAYSDANTLREARAKVEKLGLKTYTQVIENDAGKRTRVRLGPYATREEADAAAAKVKRTGLPANVLAL